MESLKRKPPILISKSGEIIVPVLPSYCAVNVNDGEFSASELVDNSQFPDNSNSAYNVDATPLSGAPDALMNSVILDSGATCHVGNNEDKFENLVPAATGETLGTGNGAATVYG